MGAAVPDPSRQEMELRLRSGLLLAPPAIAALYFGTPWLDLLVAVVSVVMAWEWQRVLGRGRFHGEDWPLVVVVAAGVALAIVGMYAPAFAVAVAGAIALLIVARLRGRPDGAWVGAGALVIVSPCIAVLWLRNGEYGGSASLLWVVGAVWTTDVAAFIAGRGIGGPKLAPSISPGKTWAGLAGGVAAAAIFSVLFGLLIEGTSPLPMAALGAIAACLGQVGDLMISVVKRRYGQKDTSAIIPGHGGVLDRLDGLLTTTPALAVLAAATSGDQFKW